MDKQHQLVTYKQSNTRRIFKFVLFLSATALLIFFKSRNQSHSPDNLNNEFIEQSRLRHLAQWTDFATTSSGAKLVIEVTPPLPDLGEPVYHQTLLTHTFGNSWGQPGKAEYKAPRNVDFNKVRVELVATSFGVQYDRLAHLYINGIPVWRTSTAEPGGREIVFNYTKELSEYATVFKKNGEVSFQLDNIVSGGLNGEFKVSLVAYYYNSEVKSLDAQFMAGTDFAITSLEPPKILSLVDNDDNPPLIYYPQEKLSFFLPSLSPSTVRAKLRIFVSGNAQEEFWYSNVIDQYANKFAKQGNPLGNKGPVRVVKVYLNDELIAVEAPPVVIYTGGISPSLWNPVVGLNAYNVKPVDVDISALLPLLAKNKENKISVKVFAGSQTPDVNVAKTGHEEVEAGYNWIVTGNIFTWEHIGVAKTFGDVVISKKEPRQSLVTVGNWDPSSLKQVVSFHESVEIFSNILFALSNLSKVLNYSLTNVFETQISNTQSYSSYGDTSQLAASVLSTARYSLGNRTLGFKQGYEAVYNLDSEQLPESTKLNVQLVLVDYKKVKFDGHNVVLVNKRQNGTSTFYLDPKGNHGFGKTDTKIKVKDFYHKSFYKRTVKASHGEVIQDVVHNGELI